MTPASIAARLTPAQRRALLWLPGDGQPRMAGLAMHLCSLPPTPDGMRRLGEMLAEHLAAGNRQRAN